ncbi:MAG: hypothetical protein GY845_20690 [Planctomycetes bacterium]|nr:hypothetical protein [Planctomycetota bacterium]
MDGKMKLCRKCKKQKDESEFYTNSRSIDGLTHSCRDCQLANAKERYKNKRGSVRKYNNYKELHRFAVGVKQKRCGRCEKWKAENQYYKHSRHKDGLAVWCKECANTATNKARKKRLAIRN